LHTLVFERRTAQHRHDFHADGCFAKSREDFGFRNRSRIVEELFHQRLVEIGYGFQQFLPPFGRFFEHIGWNGHFPERHAFVVFVPFNTPEVDQVNHTPEVFFFADGQLKRNRVTAQHFLYLLTYVQEVGPGAVHFVDESNAGHVVVVGQTPVRFRLRLNAVNGTEKKHQPVEHP